MPYYPIGNGTIITPQWFNDIQNRLYNSDTGEYKQWLDSDLSDTPGQIKDRVDSLSNEFKVTGSTGLYANYQGGKIRNLQGTTTTIASGSVLCSDNSINYICLSKTGIITSTPSIAGMPLAKLTFSSGQVVSNEDLRAKWLLFDSSDVQSNIVTKTSGFTASGNTTFLISPSNNLSITLPLNPDVGLTFYCIITPSVYSVQIASGQKVNNSVNSWPLSSSFIYQCTYFSDAVGWYIAASPIDGQLKSTSLLDMPSQLVPNKILGTNTFGSKYELQDAITYNWVVANSNYLSKPGDRIFADTSGGSFAVSLPPGAVAGNYIEIFGDFATHNLTVNRNGATIDGSVGNITLSSTKQITRFIYSGTTWISSAGSFSAESPDATVGTLGVTNSIYTSTLLAEAVQGTGAVLNTATSLCLLAYAANDNKFYLRPAIFNGSDVFTYYKATAFSDTVQDVYIEKISDTKAVIVYYIPGSDSVAIRLVSVSTSGIILLSQTVISSATYTISPAFQCTPTAFVAKYSSSRLCVVCNAGVYFYSTENDTLSLLVSTGYVDQYVGFPGSIVANGRYWYATAGYNGPGVNTGFSTVIDSQTNTIARHDISGSVLMLYLQSSGNVGAEVFNHPAGVNGAYLATLTTANPYFEIGNLSGSRITEWVPPHTRLGVRITRIGNKIVVLLSNRTQVIQGNQATDGTVSISPASNLLGLSLSPVVYSYFGYIASTKACIIIPGSVCIAYV